ncbi:ABC transporter ATP-binding protein [Mollicutes bacterium LVI A0039]|nr:ABC transporter ATP-binding protein [Mollicutes bacterium LVI A0039]
MLEFKQINLVRNDKVILNNINTKINANQITAIIGPNGSGKSSLIKLLNEKQKDFEGKIYYQDQAYERFAFVSDISILLQQVSTPDHITVYDFVKYGLIANFGMFSKLSSVQIALVKSALTKCNLLDLKDKPLCTLSGGERQRVLIASSIVRDPKLLILDEPTTFMDLKYQVELIGLIQSLHQSGMTIVIVLHDINQALSIADHCIVLKQGTIVFDDATDHITTVVLSEAFDVEIKQVQSLTYSACSE